MTLRIFACLMLSLGFLLPTTAGAADKPNIIFILADDLGFGDLGCYGSELIQTPHLDQMAAEGMRFRNFYAGATVCAPSRCVLMTGKHTGRGTVRGNSRKEIQTLTDEDVTVAERLKDAGYATALCGKWGLGEVALAGNPNKQGFDYFYGYLNQRHAHNYYPPFLRRNSEKVMLNNTPHPDWNNTRAEKGSDNDGAGYSIEKNDYSHDLIMQEATAWIDKHYQEPFFLYLSLTIPHANNEANRGLRNGQEVPDYGPYTDKDWADPDKGQAAMITRMDADVGRLFDQLAKLGIDQNTLVIFTSDNGPHKEGGNSLELFNPGGPLRGIKRDLYEGGIRVPCIARWPGKIAENSITDHISYFGDFMATACELADVPVPDDDLQSISFVPTLLGKGNQPEHDYLYWEFFEQGGRQAVRFGNWKAVRQPGFDGPIELYDLSSDIGEANNIADEHPELVERASKMMAEAHVDHENWPAPMQKPGSRARKTPPAAKVPFPF
ncbi:Arylsulfatase [Calycomorphotria hydatis]|uniref:Arylsulfatase n=2 Tax=Calycomorphotria hydatis TaxID=2528027 RepID=A0A517TAV5_9PLAN|nr:Arylsulfatase [Calycomorphotria hydatis]